MITQTTGEGWQPIGGFSDTFSARFEGNGHTISNLMISRSNVNRVGLFSYTQSGAEIANLGLLNVNITGASQVGGLVGTSRRGTINDIRDYSYEWIQTEGKSLMFSSTNTTSPSFTIPVDYIKSSAATITDIVIQLVLVHNEIDASSATLSKRITIRKIDNSTPRLDPALVRDGFTLSFAERGVADPDGIGTITAYQWQIRDLNTNNWVDIPFATTISYTILQTSINDRFYRVRVTYIDAQGHRSIEYSAVINVRADIDIDDDGLIEINDLEALNAIRYQLDGSRFAVKRNCGRDYYRLCAWRLQRL